MGIKRKIKYTERMMSEFNKNGEAVILSAMDGYEIVLGMDGGNLVYEYVKVVNVVVNEAYAEVEKKPEEEDQSIDFRTRMISAGLVHKMFLGLDTYNHKPGSRDMEKNPRGSWIHMDVYARAWNELLDKHGLLGEFESEKKLEEKKGESLEEYYDEHYKDANHFYTTVRGIQVVSPKKIQAAMGAYSDQVNRDRNIEILELRGKVEDLKGLLNKVINEPMSWQEWEQIKERLKERG